jgi:hypothetical protein
MRIAVVIASTQRPDVLSHALYSVLRQRRLPDEVMISVTSEADLPPLPVGVGAVLSQPGLSVQRNVGVKALVARPDIVAFLDDDIILHPDYLRRMETAFANHPSAALVMGHLLANGNVTLEEAHEIIRSAPKPREGFYPVESTFGGVYGCNMCVQFNVVEAEPFDEGLVLYSLMEDVDFGTRVRRHGAIYYYYGSVAVHLRHPAGRISHRVLGFSEVMNPVYLAIKGTVPTSHAVTRFALKMPVKNAILACLPGARRNEHYRRLRGNIDALFAISAAQIMPEYATAIAARDSFGVQSKAHHQQSDCAAGSAASQRPSPPAKLPITSGTQATREIHRNLL